ncbi:hypothetical protein X777_00991 [Ooceraea biroi]|nr:hypothetical protein X777_00991 [Ooceraea biroi]
MKTTYQVDYSDPAAKRMMQYTKPTAIDTVDSQRVQCCIPIRVTTEADCQPRYHPHSSRRNYNASYNGPSAKRYEYKRRNGSRRDKKCEVVESRQTRMPAWRTEYQDNINKIGQTIMRTKLHHAKRPIVPVWTTSS